MFERADDGYEDSGGDTTGSDGCRMSSTGCKYVSRTQSQFGQVALQQHRPLQLLRMNMHLLADPGTSLLLQHSLDRLVDRLCPSLHIFHVSERVSLRTWPFPQPMTGYPSVAVTFFLHEAYGEERILRVLDVLRRPPWQYHHTESSGAGNGGVRPYLLPRRDLFSLGVGLPVWGVRPVHCGSEILRVTLASANDNYQDAVRFYQTVLQRPAQQQKDGFCCFSLHNEPGVCLQLAIKQLPAGVSVKPCSATVLQFDVDEVGQLVPLLPHPCGPISATRWQTEDLDGNKVLFQVQGPPTPANTWARPQQLCTSRASQHYGGRPQSDPALDKLVQDAVGGAESLGSGSSCSTPPGSSCYSSLRSSPAPLSPLRPPVSRSLSHILLKEEKQKWREEADETNVDTGVPVGQVALRTTLRSCSADPLLTSQTPAAPGGVAKELIDCLRHAQTDPQSHCRTRGPTGGRTVALVGHGPPNCPLVDIRSTAVLLSSRTNVEETLDEFFI